MVSIIPWFWVRVPAVPLFKSRNATTSLRNEPLTTARVNYGRSREFVRWLIEKQLTQQIDELDASGTEAVPSDTPRTQLQTAKQSAEELSTDQPQDQSVGS